MNKLCVVEKELYLVVLFLEYFRLMAIATLGVVSEVVFHLPLLLMSVTRHEILAAFFTYLCFFSYLSFSLEMHQKYKKKTIHIFFIRRSRYLIS